MQDKLNADQQVGDWNEMIAATFGALSDAAGGSSLGVESPISAFPDFEHLEFKGQDHQYLAPFLQAMKQLADQRQGVA